jgi:hypothetical protein
VNRSGRTHRRASRASGRAGRRASAAVRTLVGAITPSMQQPADIREGEEPSTSIENLDSRLCPTVSRPTRTLTRCSREEPLLREVHWRVWGVRHGGAAWGLVMQHCGIAAEGECAASS